MQVILIVRGVLYRCISARSVVLLVVYQTWYMFLVRSCFFFAEGNHDYWDTNWRLNRGEVAAAEAHHPNYLQRKVRKIHGTYFSFEMDREGDRQRERERDRDEL